MSVLQNLLRKVVDEDEVFGSTMILISTITTVLIFTITTVHVA